MSDDDELAEGDPTSSEVYLVFVYGSLKRGCELHEYVADQRFIGVAKTVPAYELYDCGSYPAMVRSDRDGNAVAGEVYEVTPQRLAVLDEVEGVSQNLYLPEKVKLQPPFDGASVLAYIYQQSIDNLPQIFVWPEDSKA